MFNLKTEYNYILLRQYTNNSQNGGGLYDERVYKIEYYSSIKPKSMRKNKDKNLINYWLIKN